MSAALIPAVILSSIGGILLIVAMSRSRGSDKKKEKEDIKNSASDEYIVPQEHEIDEIRLGGTKSRIRKKRKQHKKTSKHHK